MKASDISDKLILRIIHDQCVQRQLWAHLRDIQNALPKFPVRVVLAKLRQLVRRRLVNGCGCGCRGDFEIESAACAALGVQPWREPWWKNPNYEIKGPLT